MKSALFLAAVCATTILMLLRDPSRSAGREFWLSVVRDRRAVAVGLGLFVFDVAITIVDSDSLLGLLPAAIFCALVAGAVARTRLWMHQRRQSL